MPLTTKQREDMVDALCTNCSGWTEDDREILEELDDTKLKAHTQNCADAKILQQENDQLKIENEELVANAEGCKKIGDFSDDEIKNEYGTRFPPTKKKEEEGTENEETGVTNDGTSGESDATETTEETKPMTANEWLEQAPPEIQHTINRALNFEAARKEELVKQITENERNTFTEDQLNAMAPEQLESIASLATPPKQETKTAQPMFQGAAAPVGNVAPVENVDRNDTLPLPVMDYAKAN